MNHLDKAFGFVSSSHQYISRKVTQPHVLFRLLDLRPLQKMITSTCLHHCTNAALFPHAWQCLYVYMHPVLLLFPLVNLPCSMLAAFHPQPLSGNAKFGCSDAPCVTGCSMCLKRPECCSTVRCIALVRHYRQSIPDAAIPCACLNYGFS